MQTFSLDHLDSVQFEEFCYDLLHELGFVNLNWRKGTGLHSSPADQGRDIECELEHEEVDGTRSREKWFVECKHYKRGVPPEELQSILSWARAGGADVALIIASNFLSNPAKVYLEAYKQEEKPRFNIRVWERPDLERLTVDKSRLLNKYEIIDEFSFLSILHPAHALYIKEPRFNTLDYLFDILDGLDSGERDSALGWIYEPLIQPRYRDYDPALDDISTTVADLRIDEVSYKVFKQKCYEIRRTGLLAEELIVSLIIDWVLKGKIAVGDITSTDAFIHRIEKALSFFQSKSGAIPEDEGGLELTIEYTQDHLRKLPEKIKRNYESYKYFCENVVTPLLLEEYGLLQNTTNKDSD